MGVRAVVVAAGVAAGVLIGPSVVRLAFGSGFDLGRGDLALLVGGVGGYMIAVLLGLGLIASARRAALASSWALGVTVGAVVLALAPGLVRRVELGLVAGAWCTAVLVGLAVLGPAPEFCLLAASGVGLPAGVEAIEVARAPLAV